MSEAILLLLFLPMIVELRARGAPWVRKHDYLSRQEILVVT